MNVITKAVLPLIPLAIVSCSGNKPNKQTQDSKPAKIEATYEADKSLSDSADFYISYNNLQITSKDLSQNTKDVAPNAIAQEIANEIFKGAKTRLDKPQLDKPIAKINSDNVFKILAEYKKISDEKTFFGNLQDDETLFDAILDEKISKEKKKEYFTHIKTMMEQSIAKDQGNTEFLSKEFDKAIEYTVKTWPFTKTDALNICAAKFLEIRNQINALKKASNEKAVSRAECYNYIKENDLEKSYPDILGDGKFNNNAKQQGLNCWIHGDVNAMRKTKKGREYLDNIVYKNPENGNISVYLKAAKDEGLPEGKKDGIFTFTEEEIAAATWWVSIGDGDYIALILAIDNYFKSTKNTLYPHWVEAGGNPNLFFSILFGNDAKGTELTAPWRNQKDKDAKYNEIRKYFEEEQGAISVSLPPLNGWLIEDLNTGDEEYVAPARMPANHAYAIYDMTDKYVYLTDSNHPERPSKVHKYTFVEFFNSSLWKF